MVGRPSKAVASAIAQRRTDALQLRLAGVDPLTIGRKLHADPSINSDGIPYPMGYGIDKYDAGEDPLDDDALASRVSDDLSRLLRARGRAQDEGVATLRDIQDARLERMFTVAWRQALDGDLNAMDRVVRIMERQAKLFGVDAPAKSELTGPGGGPVQLTAIEQNRQLALEHLRALSEQAPPLLPEQVLGTDEDDLVAPHDPTEGFGVDRDGDLPDLPDDHPAS